MVLPSWVHAKAQIETASSRSCCTLPVATSQIRSIASLPAVASHRPSGEKTIRRTSWRGTRNDRALDQSRVFQHRISQFAYLVTCLLYTSDAADERSSVDLGGGR